MLHKATEWHGTYIPKDISDEEMVAILDVYGIVDHMGGLPGGPLIVYGGFAYGPARINEAYVYIRRLLILECDVL